MDDRFEKYVNTVPSDRLGLKGWVEGTHFRGSDIIGNFTTDNTVVNGGKGQVAGLMNGVVTDFFEYLAIGTGTTTPAAANTALSAEVGARGSATCTRQQTTTTNDTAQLVATFTFNGSTAITECGIFDNSSSGTMLTRATFAAINVASGDSLQMTYKVQCS
jgi:hypothetical protein